MFLGQCPLPQPSPRPCWQPPGEWLPQTSSQRRAASPSCPQALSNRPPGSHSGCSHTWPIIIMRPAPKNSFFSSGRFPNSGWMGGPRELNLFKRGKKCAKYKVCSPKSVGRSPKCTLWVHPLFWKRYLKFLGGTIMIDDEEEDWPINNGLILTLAALLSLPVGQMEVVVNVRLAILTIP